MTQSPRRVRVAVLDDHPLVREGLAALLAVGAGSNDDADTAATVEVVVAGEDLDQALAAEPDVVLLDIVMDDATPIAQRVRRCLDGGSEVLLISATAPPSTILSGLRAGALGFLPKTASVDEVRTAVIDVASGEVHLTVDLAAVLTADPERPSLSPQELKALRLYAAGGKIATIARTMEVSPYTVKEYLDRVRTKYAAIGRQARTRTELYVAADRDGFLDGFERLGD